jgi:hypothetical protein
VCVFGLRGNPSAIAQQPPRLPRFPIPCARSTRFTPRNLYTGVVFVEKSLIQTWLFFNGNKIKKTNSDYCIVCSRATTFTQTEKCNCTAHTTKKRLVRRIIFFLSSFLLWRRNNSGGTFLFPSSLLGRFFFFFFSFVSSCVTAASPTRSNLHTFPSLTRLSTLKRVYATASR